MLEVTNIRKTFQSVRAVNDVSFSVGKGEIVGLLGPNGAGKTTILRSICGILKPDDGEISVNGFSLRTQEADAKRMMAYIPEVPHLYEVLTVREHIKFIAMCFDCVALFDERIKELLERFDLAEKEHALVATLSKGMKQKLAIASAFVHDAKIFLCDEPLIGLDPKAQHVFKKELQRLRDEGCAILVSTHLLDTAQNLCDRVVILQRGEKIAEGTLTQLQQKAALEGSNLEQVFLHLTQGKS